MNRVKWWIKTGGASPAKISKDHEGVLDKSSHAHANCSYLLRERVRREINSTLKKRHDETIIHIKKAQKK